MTYTASKVSCRVRYLFPIGNADAAQRFGLRARYAINTLPVRRATVPFINFPAREINCKLVYYGPGLGGKTANLQWIYDNTGTGMKGKMISLATETDRTLF